MKKSFSRGAALLALLCAAAAAPAADFGIARAADFDAARIAAAQREGALTFYSSNLPELLQQLVGKFNARFPGIKVEIVRLANPPLIARVEAEAATNRLAADLMETTDVNDGKRLEALFEDYAPPDAAQFPPEAQISKRFWPMCGAAYVVMVNTALVSKLPHTLKDMLDPAYKGRVGTVLPSAGGTAWSIALLQRVRLGAQYWRDFAAQQPQAYQSSVPLGTAIASGELSLGFAPLIAVTPLEKQGAPVTAVGLDDGIPTSLTSGGVLKGARHPNAARLFLDWATSAEGQRLYAELGCASALPGIPLPSGMQVGSGKVWVTPFAEYADRQAAWIAEWNKIYGISQ